MNKNEMKILELLKKDLSQNEIARQVGVPRSLVQKVSDRELGVSIESLKSLDERDILDIQLKSTKEGWTNTALADRYAVSTKTIARALLVRVSVHENQVTVITPKTVLGEDGGFDKSYDVTPGGFADVIDKSNKKMEKTGYVAHFFEDRQQYLLFFKHTESGSYTVGLFRYDQLTATESDSVYGFPEDMSSLADMSDALVNTGDCETGSHRILVASITEKILSNLKGKINAKGQIGYIDAITNMTIRVAMSQVYLKAEEIVKQPETEKGVTTETDLKGVTLSKFLSDHQILLLPKQVVITKDGEPRTITTDHQFYEAIVKAIKAGDIDTAFELMEPRKSITKYSNGRLLFVEGKVTWDGHDVTGTGMVKRIVQLAGRGDFDKMDRLAKFIDKVFQNPSSALVMSNRIYDFMAYSDIEIDEDGDIMVYKSVRGNYMDKHSGTISNKPGTIVRMARSFVNDNNTDLCSYGLHVCSLTYLRQCFGSNGQRVVRCKLNPKDIVSITNDYGNSKIRCCEYLVLDDYTTEYNRKYKSIDMKGIYRD